MFFAICLMSDGVSLSSFLEVWSVKKFRLSRRNLISAGVVTGVTGISATSSATAGERKVTLSQTEGPFYPIIEQTDKDTDLTRYGDRDVRALGDVVLVVGRVLNEEGAPVEDAVVDIWQANAAGRYAHEKDPNPAPLDPNFQTWAIMTTSADGGYGFRTIKPGAYPVEPDWTRPPHIHIKVSKRGYRELTTQMYFPGDPLNDVDRLLNEAPEDRRGDLIAKPESLRGDPDTDTLLRFDVVLAKI